MAFGSLNTFGSGGGIPTNMEDRDVQYRHQYRAESEATFRYIPVPYSGKEPVFYSLQQVQVPFTIQTIQWIRLKIWGEAHQRMSEAGGDKSARAT